MTTLSQIASGDIQSSEAVTGTIERIASTSTSSTAASTSTAATRSTSLAPETKGGQGLRLGANRAASTDWIEEENSVEVAEAWNEGDLINVHADSDDWGMLFVP